MLVAAVWQKASAVTCQGLHRTVTVYSNTGEKIGEWNGKFDVSSSENETYFDIDDKRVIIHGGIVIDEEADHGKD